MAAGGINHTFPAKSARYFSTLFLAFFLSIAYAVPSSFAYLIHAPVSPPIGFSASGNSTSFVHATSHHYTFFRVIHINHSVALPIQKTPVKDSIIKSKISIRKIKKSGSGFARYFTPHTRISLSIPFKTFDLSPQRFPELKASKAPAHQNAPPFIALTA